LPKFEYSLKENSIIQLSMQHLRCPASNKNGKTCEKARKMRLTTKKKFNSRTHPEMSEMMQLAKIN
jgi:hypothetical protein